MSTQVEATKHRPKRSYAPRYCSNDEYLRHIGWSVQADGCWIWGGKFNPQGYGSIRRKRKGRYWKVLAHRMSFETWVGPIPEGHIVRHSCDNPPCINPQHLSTGTHADNVRDRDERGRTATGERNGRAVLTEAIVKDIRSLWARGKRQSEIAKELQVSPDLVHKIVRNKIWRKV